MKLQVTLFATNGKYRPISTIIEVESIEDYVKYKKVYQTKAITNICHNRRTTWKDLKEQSYTTIKVREYDLEKIEKEKNQKTKEEIIEKLYQNYKNRLDK